MGQGEAGQQHHWQEGHQGGEHCYIFLLQKVRFSNFEFAFAFVFVFVSETEEGVCILIYLMAWTPLFMSRRGEATGEAQIEARSFNKPCWKVPICRG